MLTQLVGGHTRIFGHVQDRNRKRALQIPHILQHAGPVSGPGPFGDRRDLLRWRAGRTWGIGIPKPFGGHGDHEHAPNTVTASTRTGTDELLGSWH